MKIPKQSLAVSLIPRWRAFLVTLATGCLAAVGIGAEMPSRGIPQPQSPLEVSRVAKADYGQLPLSFEPNVGQAPKAFDAIARGPGYAVYLAQDEMQVVLRPATKQDASPSRSMANMKRKRERGAGQENPATVLGFKLRAANGEAQQHLTSQLPGIVNYLRGNDPAAWHQGVPTYARLQYDSLYPGIDLVYHGNQRQLEHDFVVAPGADPRAIAWEISGADRIELNAEGALLLHTPAGILRMPKAYAYQDLPSGRVAVAVDYELDRANTVRFALGAYDASATLVIDPVLYYSTFLGGSAYDEAYGIAVDSTGNAYVTGVSYSTNFPLASARQSAKGADGDAFVAKINPAGNALVFCSYLGGNGYEEGDAVGVDAAGSVYVAGVTFSTDFPTANANQAANAGNGDAFLTKLNSTGATLTYSTYYGFDGYEEAAALAVSSSGIACIAGTIEQTSTNDMDGFVAKYAANGLTQTYAVLVQGSGSDAVYGLALDASLNAYLTGQTDSRDLPFSSTAFDKIYGGSTDAFVAKVNAAGTAYVYLTYLGGSRTDLGNAIACDSSGFAYVTGETYSFNFPTVTPYQAAVKTGGDAFLTKINTNGSALVYSTYFGGSNSDYGAGIAVDSTGSAHITGYTASSDFPKYYQSQSSIGGGGDAFVTRFASTGKTLIYSTFLGGKDVDYANAIAVDSSLVSYVAGYTVSTNYPTYLPLQNAFAGVADAFVTKIGNPVVSITATDAAASEPGTDKGRFTISRTGNPAIALTVYFTVTGSATKGTDYQTITSPVTIPANSTSTTIDINPIDDQVWEGTETVIVTLSANLRYTVGTANTATVNIADNEVKPTVTIQATDLNASEPGTNTGRFTVTRNTSTVGPLTVNFTVTGTATKSTDYTNIGTSVTLPAGSTTATITITPIDDALTEGDETVILTLAASALYTNGSPSTATVTIADDEVPPTVTITPVDPTGAEPGTDTGRFRLTRTGGTAQSLAVSYTIAGTATRGTDYNTINTSTTIAAGSATADIVITPKDDALAEGSESVVLALTAGAYTVGSPGTATVVITDDETGPVNQTVTVKATDATASEAGAQAGQFTFTRVGSTAASLAVKFAYTGTATLHTDYDVAGGNGTVTIPAGSDTATVTVTPIDDLIIEGNETSIVTLVADAAYTIGLPKTATVTIADDDTVKPTVTVAATDAAAAEAGTNTGTYTFTRTGGSLNVALTVNYARSGTATNLNDFSGVPGSVTIPAGSASVIQTLTPVDDLAVEGNETVIVTISANSIYTVGSPSSATITIADNDGTVPTVTVAATDASASEPGTNTGTFTFTRAGGDTSVALTVQFAVSGTATQFSDYSGVNSSVTIAAGSTTATATATPLDDLAIEGDETVVVTLSADALYAIGAQNTATVTIVDNDSTKPTVTVAATDPNAGEAGTNTGTFTFTRTGGDTSVSLSVNWTISGTATQFSDYTGVFSSVTIPAGSTTATATLTVNDDLIIESSETVIVTLNADSLYTVGAANSATATIADNDTVKPTVTVAATDSSASEAGTNTGTFTFTRTGGSTDVALSVSFTAGGTATMFSDYTGVFSSITIPAGSATATATLTVNDDLIIETSETVTVTLNTDPNNIYLVGTPNSATATITDDDTVKPTVTIVATDATAAEPGATVNNGTFTVTRNGGSLNVSLSVSLTVGGTATQFSDYSGAASSITIPVGSTTATITITPNADALAEGTETVTSTVDTDPNSIYNVGSPNSATINIQNQP